MKIKPDFYFRCFSVTISKKYIITPHEYTRHTIDTICLQKSNDSSYIFKYFVSKELIIIMQ